MQRSESMSKKQGIETQDHTGTMKRTAPASAVRYPTPNGLAGPRSPSPVLPAVDTSGFCESQIGVLSPKVLRHLV
jgi:hypothetical protein